VKYEGRFNGRHGTLTAVGSIDTQEIIEAFGPLTDINFMLHRLSMGDSSVLSSRSPMYGDFSGLPSNPIDAINLVENARSSFLSLSVEDRQKYNNDYRVWLSCILSGSPMQQHDNDSAPAGDPVSTVKE
jgi:hypothetical protein